MFLQDNFKGGVSADGHAYQGMSYFNYDTINFQNSVPVGATIRKAFLISLRFTPWCTQGKDTPTKFTYNGHLMQFDSSDIVTNVFYCDQSESCFIWNVVQDVTAVTINSGNELIKPLVTNGQDYNYYSIGYFLVILYDDPVMPTTNVAILLNNKTYTPTMPYPVSNLNPINNSNDVALSALPQNTNSVYDVSLGLTSSLGTFTIGDLYANTANMNNIHTAPGSFYYQNNSLFGLVDDTPNNTMDSTDALANIKTYLANSATTFTIDVNLHATSPGCFQAAQAFVLAYSSPCPPFPNSSFQNYIVCGSGSVQLSAMGYSNSTYEWHPGYGLNDSLIRNPFATPSVTTTYNAFVTDSNGCSHTEKHKIIIDQIPRIDSVKTFPFTCGLFGGEGSAIVYSPSAQLNPNQYSIGAGFQDNNSFSVLQAGTYTMTVKDSLGCANQQSFTIPFYISAVSQFNLNPDTACYGTTCQLINLSTGANNYNWYLNDSLFSVLQSPSLNLQGNGNYTVTLIAYSNQLVCSDTLTGTLSVLMCNMTVNAPNIFTPNADGINDTWQLLIIETGVNNSTFEINIFDRWGIEVFETTDPKHGWDGRTTSGIECSEGTYYYLAKYQTTNGIGKTKQETLKGFLQLIK